MTDVTFQRLIRKMGEDHVWVCEKCGSADIQKLAWVDANSNQFQECHLDKNNLKEHHWCTCCRDAVQFTSLAKMEAHMNKTVSELPMTLITEPYKAIWFESSYIKKQRLWNKMRIEKII